MLVIADSSPLNYLVLIGHVDTLPALFGSVVIPIEVAQELSHPAAPEAVGLFISTNHDWLEIQRPREVSQIGELDQGECAAISLALELNAELLLIDDLDGRRAAEERGISVAGTLGLLKLAATNGLIDLASSIEKLRGCGFYVSEELLQEFLRGQS
jgi:predicted nucleic acid-binding protein